MTYFHWLGRDAEEAACDEETRQLLIASLPFLDEAEED